MGAGEIRWYSGARLRPYAKFGAAALFCARPEGAFHMKTDAAADSACADHTLALCLGSATQADSIRKSLSDAVK